MPPAFCTLSAPDQCHAVPHEHSSGTHQHRNRFMRFAKSLWMRSASRCCLRVVREACLPPSGVTCRAQLQLSVFWHRFNPASGKPLLRQHTHPKSLIALLCTPSLGTFPIPLGTSGVGFVQQSSKSPQSSSICNHTLPRGDLLDSRLSNNVVSFSRNAVLSSNHGNEDMLESLVEGSCSGRLRCLGALV